MLTYFGIENANTEKRERLVTDEITSNMGGVAISRNSRMNAREQACKEINRLFGLEVSVDFEGRIEDLPFPDDEIPAKEGVEE